MTGTPVNSVLLRSMRASEGSTEFAWQVEAACWLHDTPYTDHMRRKVSLEPDVNNAIVVHESGLVDVSAVTDAAIINAVAAVKARLPDPKPESVDPS